MGGYICDTVLSALDPINEMASMSSMKLIRKYTDWIPARVVSGLLLFVGSIFVFGHHVSLNLSLVAMVNRSETEGTVGSPAVGCNRRRDPLNFTAEVHQPQGNEFAWSPSTQGLLLGSLFYGIIATHAIGGLLVERFSPKIIGLVSLLGSSFLALLIPELTRSGGAVVLFLLRASQGALLGVFMPVSYALVARWSPLTERTMLVSLIHVGNVLGGAITVVGTGYLIAYQTLGGWPSVFYLTGGFGCAFCLFWYLFAYDCPDDHPTISPDELLLIAKSTGSSTSEKKRAVPWGAVVKSVPFWSLLVMRFGANWGFLTITTATPLFLHSALNMNMEQNGLVNGLLFVASIVASLLSGFMADFMRKKTNLSITTIRKTMSGIAFTSGALCWFSITAFGCNSGAAVVIIISTKLATSLSIGGDFGAIVDMAPQFAGPLSGILYTFSDLTGVLSPMFTGFITSQDETFDRWHIVFCTAAGIQLFALAQFLVLGSAELQPWAQDEDDVEKIKKSKQNVTESGPLINEGKRFYDSLSISRETS